MEELWQLLLNADEKISDIVVQYGTLTYIIIFSIIFIETGLVVITFFPGDGLLFACGILASTGELDLTSLILILSMATFLGNTSNYMIGKYIGTKYFKKNKARRNKYLAKAFRYFDKHRNIAIIFSRYFPFMRSFIPFVAGLTEMKFALYTLLNFVGAFLWISTYVLLGYFLGEIPIVKQYYGIVLSIILIIVIVSTILSLLRFLYRSKLASQAKRKKRLQQHP